MEKHLNINSYTHISYAHGLGGLRSSINYVAKGKSHNHAVPKRALEIKGFNCSSNPNLAYKEMKSTLNRAYINPTSISCIRDIETFKNVNWKDPKQCKIAQKVNSKLLNQRFKHAMVLSVFQSDGKHQIYHVHNIICSRQFTNLKSISHDTRWWTVAHSQDQILKSMGFQPLNNGKLSHSHTASRGALYYHKRHNSFTFYLENQISKALKLSNNLKEYQNKLNLNGIQLEPFKMSKNKSNSKRYIKLYNHPTKDGKYIKLANNKYARLKKHFSYSFKYLGQNIIIRDKKLNYKFRSKNIIKLFNYDNNIQKVRNILKNQINYKISTNSKIEYKNNYISKNNKIIHNNPMSIRKALRNDKSYQNKEKELLYQNSRDDLEEQNKYKKIEKVANIDNYIQFLKDKYNILLELKRLYHHGNSPTRQ